MPVEFANSRGHQRTIAPADAMQIKVEEYLMKTQVMLAALLVAVAAMAEQDQRPDRRAIDVQVVNGQITVSEEVAETSENEGALIWRLSQKEFAFPDNGIVIDSNGKHACRVIANGRAVRCGKLRHVHDERYKYTVNVIDAASKQPLPPLDPWIHNT